MQLRLRAQNGNYIRDQEENQDQPQDGVGAGEGTKNEDVIEKKAKMRSGIDRANLGANSKSVQRADGVLKTEAG